MLTFSAISTPHSIIKIKSLKRWNRSFCLLVPMYFLALWIRISTLLPTAGTLVKPMVQIRYTYRIHGRGVLTNSYSFYFPGTFASVGRLKKKNPSIKVLLVVNEIVPESLSFSRRDFIISASDVLKTSGFDGLVLSDVKPTAYSKILLISRTYWYSARFHGCCYSRRVR